jgi:hypothetical protein
MDAAKRALSDAAFSFRGFNTRGNALQAPDGDDSDKKKKSTTTVGGCLRERFSSVACHYLHLYQQ